jgi:hypothetical protein
MLRLTGKLAVTVGAGSVLITAPACGGGGEGPFSDCELVASGTYPYYGGQIIYSIFYCETDIYGEECFATGDAYGSAYTCFDIRYDL